MFGYLSSNLSPNVLIFDSGVGGLPVYNKTKDFLPDLRYIYAFDNVAFPYGEKNEKFIIKRVVDIVTAVHKRYPLTLALIACNTASTASLLSLRKEFQFPIVGMVPAIKTATDLTKNGIVGLLATNGTIKHPYTKKLINRFAKKCNIIAIGSTDLVKIAESKLYGKTVLLNKLQHILYPWLRMPEQPDTVILGCTHFLLLQNELLQILPKKTQLVDSSNAIVKRVIQLLKDKNVSTKISDSDNIAFCMDFSKKTEQLLPILNFYGFKKLEKLVL